MIITRFTINSMHKAFDAGIVNAKLMPFHQLREKLVKTYGGEDLCQKVENGELTISYFSGKYASFLG